MSKWRKLLESTNQREVGDSEVDKWMEANRLEERVERILTWSYLTLKRVLVQRTGAAR